MENAEWKMQNGMSEPGAAPTVLTELGLEVPLAPGEEYREHTAARWKERERPSYDFAIYLIRDLGITNKSKLEELVTEHRQLRGVEGISRNSIIALINDTEVFKPGEINDIIARSSALLTMESIGAARDVVEKAKSTKDLGALAMVMTSANNIKQLGQGGPTQVKVVHHKFDIGDFEKLKHTHAVKAGPILEADEAAPAALPPVMNEIEEAHTKAPGHEGEKAQCKMTNAK